jgi:hypothetical protein
VLNVEHLVISDRFVLEYDSEEDFYVANLVRYIRSFIHIPVAPSETQDIRETLRFTSLF